MIDIDTRSIESGRYFTPAEAEHRTNVCLIGSSLAEQLFPSVHSVGKPLRIGSEEFTVIGVMEKIGSVLGQDQDNYVIVPLPVFLRIHATPPSVTINLTTSSANFT